MNPAQQKANAKKFIERWQNEPGNGVKSISLDVWSIGFLPQSL